MPASVIALLAGTATVEQIAGHFELAESDLLAGITGTLASGSDRERELEEENRALREALLREATLRAELLLSTRPRRTRRRRSPRGVRHRR